MPQKESLCVELHLIRRLDLLNAAQIRQAMLTPICCQRSQVLARDFAQLLIVLFTVHLLIFVLVILLIEIFIICNCKKEVVLREEHVRLLVTALQGGCPSVPQKAGVICRLGNIALTERRYMLDFGLVCCTYSLYLVMQLFQHDKIRSQERGI